MHYLPIDNNDIDNNFEKWLITIYFFSLSCGKPQTIYFLCNQGFYSIFDWPESNYSTILKKNSCLLSSRKIVS